MIIDYEMLAIAVKHFRSLNYTQIEVPWLVNPSIDSITRPADKRAFYVHTLDRNLCGSGEQGFLELAEQLPFDHTFFTVTPCFRDDVVDELHVNQFVKLELGAKSSQNNENFQNLFMLDASNLFYYFFPQLTLERVKTETGTDINAVIAADVKIELGSYGLRTLKQGWWAYGTGLALPRASTVLSHYRKRVSTW